MDTKKLSRWYIGRVEWDGNGVMWIAYTGAFGWTPNIEVPRPEGEAATPFSEAKP